VGQKALLICRDFHVSACIREILEGLSIDFAVDSKEELNLRPGELVKCNIFAGDSLVYFETEVLTCLTENNELILSVKFPVNLEIKQRRKNKRFNCFEKGNIKIDKLILPVLVLNVSLKGALVKLSESVPGSKESLIGKEGRLNFLETKPEFNFEIIRVEKSNNQDMKLALKFMKSSKDEKIALMKKIVEIAGKEKGSG